MTAELVEEKFQKERRAFVRQFLLKIPARREDSVVLPGTLIAPGNFKAGYVLAVCVALIRAMEHVQTTFGRNEHP